MPRQKSMFDADAEGAAPFVPVHPTLKNMRAAVQDCKGCDLYAHATQAVFGEGPASAKIVLVGEQPGNSEDLAGRPFVGPAGEILDRALREVGLDRSQVYVTNAVKHFAFEERGKRRIHRTPRQSEINACRPWIEAELDSIKPDIVVCLGATAAKALMGSQFRLTQEHGIFRSTDFAEKTIATYHPSAVLRADTEESKQAIYQLLVKDLTNVVHEERKLAKKA
jgi:uracil-DNA glycosylase